MGIVKYIPKKKDVIDRRNADGGYYEAICDECGNVFYPKRSSAKYCSRSCTVMSYRRTKKDKIVTPKASKTTDRTKIGECIGVVNVPDALTSLGCNTKKLMGAIRNSCESLEIGKTIQFESVIIHKVSTRKFGFYKEE